MLRLGLYQHFKGAYYEVLGLATHTETEELLVLYRERGSTLDDPRWARPVAMFNEMVRVGHKSVPRFKYVEDEGVVHG